MRIVKLFITVGIILFLFGCSKKEATYKQYDLNGIRITENSTTPADSTFRIELKEVGFIDMENETDSNRYISMIANIDIDIEGNLYIMDIMKRRIHKYDKNCNFVKTFGRMGNGPGEFEYPGTINVRKDSIFIPNLTTLQIIKYDTDGNFLENKRLDDITQFPRYPKKFGGKYISQSSDIYPDEEKGGLVMHEEISLYDRNFNYAGQLYKNEYHEKSADSKKLSKLGLVTAYNDSLLYVYEKSIDKYQIDVFDNEGIKVGEIRKNYIRIKDTHDSFVHSVTSMVSDKYGRLWIEIYDEADPKKYVYDVFDNDIFINRVVLDIEEGYYRYFVEDKLVAVNRDNNNVKVYEY
ncbi:MAG TPA: 6-bladed beta-propeller [Clostridiales bacterium]|nr:6-bladed beta-propeller [Clostridiales bacterium]